MIGNPISSSTGTISIGYYSTPYNISQNQHSIIINTNNESSFSQDRDSIFIGESHINNLIQEKESIFVGYNNSKKIIPQHSIIFDNNNINSDYLSQSVHISSIKNQNYPLSTHLKYSEERKEINYYNPFYFSFNSSSLVIFKKNEIISNPNSFSILSNFNIIPKITNLPTFSTQVYYFGSEKPQFNLCVGNSSNIAISFDKTNYNLIQDNNLTFAKTIAYDGLVYIIGGDKIIFTYDCLTFELCNNYSLLSSCNKILYGDNIFIGTGVGATYTLITSKDGIHWVGNNQLLTTGNDIVYNNSIYLALGSGTALSNTILKSTDGINWVEVTSSFFTDAKSGIWDGHQFIVVGQGSSQIVHSSDGILFTSSASIFTTYTQCIAYNGERYVASGVGGAFSIAVSLDSYVWTGITTFSISNPSSIFWDGSKFNILSGDLTNSIGYSFDGLLYSGKGTSIFSTTYAMESNLKHKDRIVFDSSLTGEINIQDFCIIGMDNNTQIKFPMMYSFNGHLWYPLSSHLFTDCMCILWSGDKWIIGNNDNLFYSYDLKNWETITGTTANSVSEVFCNDTGAIYVAFSDTLIYFSFDGMYWNENTTTPYSLILKSCAFHNNLFVAVGNDSANNNSIFTSTNGVNWTYSSNPLTVANDIIWTGSNYIVCGDGASDNVCTSTDGVNWVGRGFITSAEGRCITCNLDGSVIVLGSSTQLYYSTNQGVNWTSISTFLSSHVKLQYFNNRFLIIGTSILNPKAYAYYSFDGITWYRDFNIHSLLPTASTVKCIQKTISGVKPLLLEKNLDIVAEVIQSGITSFSLTKVS